MALKDGFTTGAGMGLGLGGSKRLVNEFAIESASGKRNKGYGDSMEVASTEWVPITDQSSVGEVRRKSHAGRPAAGIR